MTDVVYYDEESEWPSGWVRPVKLPVVVDWTTNTVHDFTHRYPLVPREGNDVLRLRYEAGHDARAVYELILGGSWTTDAELRVLTEQNKTKLTLGYLELIDDLMNLKSRIEQRFWTTIRNLKFNALPHRFPFAYLDINNRDDVAREIPVMYPSQQIHTRWVGYTCLLTSGRSRFTGVGVITSVTEDSVWIKFSGLVGSIKVSSGFVYPLYKDTKL